MSSRAQLPHAHGGDADGGLFRGQARNKFIDAANGGGDAVDDPASAGGEVASGVAALAVRLRYRLRPGHRDIQFIGGACLRWTCIARQT